MSAIIPSSSTTLKPRKTNGSRAIRSWLSTCNPSTFPRTRTCISPEARLVLKTGTVTRSAGILLLAGGSLGLAILGPIGCKTQHAQPVKIVRVAATDKRSDAQIAADESTKDKLAHDQRFKKMLDAINGKSK